MQHRKTLSCLAAPLVVAALAAPVAVAMPADPAPQADPRQLDMHASTVQKPESPVQDLRSENTADPSRAPEPPIGLPTWPLNPEPLTPPVSNEPVATGSGDGDGIEWPLSGILIAGAALLGGTLGVAGTRYRVSHTHAA